MKKADRKSTHAQASHTQHRSIIITCRLKTLNIHLQTYKACNSTAHMLHTTLKTKSQSKTHYSHSNSLLHIILPSYIGAPEQHHSYTFLLELVWAWKLFSGRSPLVISKSSALFAVLGDLITTRTGPDLVAIIFVRTPAAF